MPTPYLQPLFQVWTGNAHCPQNQTFQNWMHILYSTRILQTLKSFFSRSWHRLLPGYHTWEEIEREKNRQRKDKSYDEANETKSITVSDGFVTPIKKNSRYIGSFVLYNFCDNCDVDRRLAYGSSLMGDYNHCCKDTYVDLCREYLIFLAIPINIVLWGCESWSLCVSLLNKLEVFLHWSIRSILGFTTTKVKKGIITNETIHQRFFDIPRIQNQLAKRQLTFIRKSDSQLWRTTPYKSTNGVVQQ